MAPAGTKAMTKILPFSEPRSNAVSETQKQLSVSLGAPTEQIPTSDRAMTRRFGSILGWHAFLGVVCLALLGLGFLLLETGDWIFFLSCGAASCAIGIATSGLSAYFSGRGGVMRSLLFALPVLLVGVVARIGLSPSVGLPLNVWCAFGVLMFVASYAGGLVGAVYGKKRHPKTTPSQYFSSQQTALSVMNENEPPLAPEALNQPIPKTGMSRKWRIVLAFSLGVTLIFLAYFVTMVLMTAVLGNEPGTVALLMCAAFIGVWVCFFITQFFLSYGNPRAVRKDWPVIAALNIAPFCSVILALIFVAQKAALALLVVAGITLACSYAGSALASLIARRRSP
jgi:energy-converting hydrogenase Eha subunit E